MSITEGLSHSRRLILRTLLLAGVALTGVVLINPQAGEGPPPSFKLDTLDAGSMICIKFDWSQPGNYFPELFDPPNNWLPLDDYEVEQHEDAAGNS